MLVFLALVVCLGSTGCKKKDDKAIPIIQPDVGGTHYYGASMFGDLLNVQVNEASALYSYLQLAGPNLIGVGQDALIPTTGLSTYAFYNADLSAPPMWALNPGKFVALGGDGYNMLGVPVVSSQYTVASITGMYNILSMDYDPAEPSVTSDYGTLQINADHTWEIWFNVDGSTAPATSEDNGTWTDGGNGFVSTYSNEMGANIGKFAIYPSANGNIFVMQYGAYHPVYGWMYGMLVGLPQTSVASGDFNGIYDAINSDATTFDQVTVSGGTVTTGGGPLTLTFDSPWTGMIQDSDGNYVIASQDGLIVIVSYLGGSVDDNMTIAVIEQ
jgi:hypothetical protein